MSFVSFKFYIFIAAFILLYYLIPKKYRWITVLSASVFFYILNSGSLFVMLFITAASTFFAALRIEKINGITSDELTKKELKQMKTAKKRAVIALASLLNFGFLVILKYKRLIVPGVQALVGVFGFETGDLSSSLLMPLGISFYTFQSIGYIVDVSRGEIKAQRNFLHYLTFVSFFPQIVQGPISRYGDLEKQLIEGNDFDYRRTKFGLQLIVWGAFKKLVIADRAAIVVNTVFMNYPEYTGSTLWLGLLFYALQIYADFSGGIDVARGVAQAIGVTLEENFRRPYFATSVSDFWRRWHITLGGWCRDYIFYPLSLSKPFGRLSKKTRKIFGNYIGKQLPVILSQLIVFIIIGMWHGSEFKYIAFGLYHGAFIIGGILFDGVFRKIRETLHIKDTNFPYRVFCIVRTFFIVTVGRVFSRAGSFLTAVAMMRSCFSTTPAGQPGLYDLGVDRNGMTVLLIASLILFAVSVIQECGYEVRSLIAKCPLPVRWLLYIAGIVAIVIYGVYGKDIDSGAFIYMRY